MKRPVQTLAATLIAWTALCSTGNAITYEKWKGMSEGVRGVYLSGMGEGFSWANTYIDPPAADLYCQPNALGLSGAQYISLVEDYADRHMSAGSHDVEIGILLIEALKEAFPC